MSVVYCPSETWLIDAFKRTESTIPCTHVSDQMQVVCNLFLYGDTTDNEHYTDGYSLNGDSRTNQGIADSSVAHRETISQK